MNKEQDQKQMESELEEPGATESVESVNDKQEPYIDQEMADEYSFTQKQAQAMSLYL